MHVCENDRDEERERDGVKTSQAYEYIFRYIDWLMNNKFIASCKVWAGYGQRYAEDTHAKGTWLRTT